MSNICGNCKWWYSDPFGGSICVLLTGTRHNRDAKVRCGGKQPIQTDYLFGCNQWEPIRPTAAPGPDDSATSASEPGSARETG
jgi:hypothetical protein